MPRQRDPTPAEHAELLAAVRAGRGIPWLRRKFGFGSALALRWRNMALDELGDVPSQTTLKETDRLIADAEVRLAYEASVRLESRLVLARRAARREWTPAVPGPVAVATLADIHYGAAGTDYEALDRDTATILHTDGLYCLLGGDGVDNHIKHLAAMLAQKMTPRDQWAWYADFIARLAPKLIGIVGGNHEAWSILLTGLDPLKAIADRLEIMHDPNELLFDAHVGDADYRCMVRHRYRYNAMDNPGHSVRRMYDWLRHFDVGFVCDKHSATIEPFNRDGKLRWAARPGSYQVTSEFSQAHGFRDAWATTPAVILMPDARTHGFVSLDWAASTLKGIRREWQRRTANGKAQGA